MTTLSETPRVFAWIRATTNALAAGGAHRDVAPKGATTPYVVYGLQSAIDVAGAAGIRLWQDGLYMVKVVGPASQYAAMVTAADAIDSALQLASGNTSDGTIIRCAREQSLAYSEVIDGQQWSHIGAIWRIYSRKT